MRAAIETVALSKRYRKVSALQDLNLIVPEGTVCGFLGPNGAGKTTTMRILMGLTRPSAGSARLLGASIGSDGVSLRSRVGYLSQDPAFYPRFRVRQVLRFVARRYLSGSRRAIEARVDDVLERVGLAERSDRRVKALSGGERRRLGIGQAMIGRPDLLILDEPSVGLDPEGRFQVLNLIEELRGDLTVFYSSHILDDVQRVADHVVILDHGEIIEQGPMEEFLGSGATYRVILDGEVDSNSFGPLRDLSWVEDVVEVGSGAWNVAASDPAAAERELLRVLHQRFGRRVTDLRPLVRSLEDIYLGMVEADVVD
ncbi:MAG: ABC transporter ATP-binding protein [Acidimicrobiia bacterium]|nr:ABC transporter ATP-binding protein [Acidimicrobiia bacterium]